MILITYLKFIFITGLDAPMKNLIYIIIFYFLIFYWVGRPFSGLTSFYAKFMGRSKYDLTSFYAKYIMGRSKYDLTSFYAKSIMRRSKYDLISFWVWPFGALLILPKAFYRGSHCFFGRRLYIFYMAIWGAFDTAEGFL